MCLLSEYLNNVSCFRDLTELGILEKMSVGMIHTLILSQIQSHVQDSCVGNFASSQIDMLEKV